MRILACYKEFQYVVLYNSIVLVKIVEVLYETIGEHYTESHDCTGFQRIGSLAQNSYFNKA